MGSPFLLLVIVALIVGAFLPAAQANAPAPAPASDGLKYLELNSEAFIMKFKMAIKKKGSSSTTSRPPTDTGLLPVTRLSSDFYSTPNFRPSPDFCQSSDFYSTRAYTSQWTFVELLPDLGLMFIAGLLNDARLPLVADLLPIAGLSSNVYPTPDFCLSLDFYTTPDYRPSPNICPSSEFCRTSN
ncbi:hypothetical protein KFK09_005061 [Dendrobium nobile]|uniref:Uncharacterized protein n=1 Tax=Dendrobium nobile TaxID=94219 RepID=A0A8T3C073_DENNO|nr:hypothetical protein KFK09_005061 [Dendrobium nobile]